MRNKLKIYSFNLSLTLITQWFREGHRKCRELWPEEPIEYEKVFNIFLDMVLLVLPLSVLGATYFMITKTLWQGIQTERDFKNHLNKYTNSCKWLGTFTRLLNFTTFLPFRVDQISSKKLSPHSFFLYVVITAGYIGSQHIHHQILLSLIIA